MKRIVFICMLIQLVFSQSITNAVQKIENGRVVISFDLKGDNDKVYDIQLSAAKEGKTITPYAIAGDIINLAPGKNHEIWWEPVLEGRDLLGWTVNVRAVYNLFVMVFVQGGTFEMGSRDGGSDEKPIHTVTLDDFYIAKTEVTQAQYREVMGKNPSDFSGCDDCPVESVSWKDIQKFLQKLNKMTGEHYRLPTEAEWEYAARGGNKSRGYEYAGSNQIDAVAWYRDNSNSKTHPVGQKQANELGLYDMTGNVWEWCNDWYADDYYERSPQNNPEGPSSGSYRVLRGGSWDNDARYCRVAYRSRYAPDFRDYSFGFRLVRSAQ